MDVMKSDRPSGPKRRNIKVCLCVSVGILIAIVLIIVILGLTVFKAKDPITNVDSITLDNVHVGLDVARLRADLNITLDIHVSVKNPNKVSFRYTDTAAHLNYRGQLVGEAPLPADQISSGETKGMNLTLTVMAGRLLSNSQLYSDVASGALPLNTLVRISGKVTVLGIFKVHVVATSYCDLTVNLTNRNLANQTCRYKTKL